MDDLVKISEAANLALHTAIYLAQNPGRKVAAAEIAEAFGASKAHLFKVLQRLVKADFAHATRGPKGGYELARKPDKISLLNVFEEIEGKIRPKECLFVRKVCSQKKCVMGNTLGEVNSIVCKYLSDTKLSDFV
ncbi:MAG: RrF2 family transcriptional regulator [Planctomycetota bacterium]|jgi:Rrf2 family protein